VLCVLYYLPGLAAVMIFKTPSQHPISTVEAISALVYLLASCVVLALQHFHYQDQGPAREWAFAKVQVLSHKLTLQKIEIFKSDKEEEQRCNWLRKWCCCCCCCSRSNKNQVSPLSQSQEEEQKEEQKEQEQDFCPLSYNDAIPITFAVSDVKLHLKRIRHLWPKLFASFFVSLVHALVPWIVRWARKESYKESYLEVWLVLNSILAFIHFFLFTVFLWAADSAYRTLSSSIQSVLATTNPSSAKEQGWKAYIPLMNVHNIKYWLAFRESALKQVFRYAEFVVIVKMLIMFSALCNIVFVALFNLQWHSKAESLVDMFVWVWDSLVLLVFFLRLTHSIVTVNEGVGNDSHDLLESSKYTVSEQTLLLQKDLQNHEKLTLSRTYFNRRERGELLQRFSDVQDLVMTHQDFDGESMKQKACEIRKLSAVKHLLEATIEKGVWVDKPQTIANVKIDRAAYERGRNTIVSLMVAVVAVILDKKFGIWAPIENLSADLSS